MKNQNFVNIRKVFINLSYDFINILSLNENVKITNKKNPGTNRNLKKGIHKIPSIQKFHRHTKFIKKCIKTEVLLKKSQNKFFIKIQKIFVKNIDKSSSKTYNCNHYKKNEKLEKQKYKKNSQKYFPRIIFKIERARSRINIV